MLEMDPPALSVVIPTLHAAEHLDACLTSLTELTLSYEVVVVDGGSCDNTLAIAHLHDAYINSSPPGRGIQLHGGAEAAKGNWLLFLHADTVLEVGWATELQTFLETPENIRKAAVFSFALDDACIAARCIEWVVAWRCRHLSLPYGDQGLLIHRDFYEQVGGYKLIPIMEDVDMVWRLRFYGLHTFGARAITSSARYRRDGWAIRPLRNLLCLILWVSGMAPEKIAKVYG